MGVVTTHKELAALIAKFDSDGSGLIEFDEFLELLAQQFDFNQEEEIIDGNE